MEKSVDKFAKMKGVKGVKEVKEVDWVSKTPKQVILHSFTSAPHSSRRHSWFEGEHKAVERSMKGKAW